jgi:hypothetical protein
MSVWTSFVLPTTCRSFPSSCFSAATASATSPWSTLEFCHSSSSTSVVDATYFGNVFTGRAMACSSSAAFGQ